MLVAFDHCYQIHLDTSRPNLGPGARVFRGSATFPAHGDGLQDFQIFGNPKNAYIRL